MLRVFLAVCCVLAANAGATAVEKCDVPLADWKPRESLRAILEGGGWTVRSIRSQDGCYEADAIDPQGHAVEAFFNPQTLEAIGSGEAAADDRG